MVAMATRVAGNGPDPAHCKTTVPATAAAEVTSTVGSPAPIFSDDSRWSLKWSPALKPALQQRQAKMASMRRTVRRTVVKQDANTARASREEVTEYMRADADYQAAGGLATTVDTAIASAFPFPGPCPPRSAARNPGRQSPMPTPPLPVAVTWQKHGGASVPSSTCAFVLRSHPGWSTEGIGNEHARSCTSFALPG